MMDLVHHQQGAETTELGQVQIGCRRDRLVGRDIARESSARVGLIIRRTNRQRVSERTAPDRVAERLLRLQAQAVARHDPAHALHHTGGDQPRCRDHRQQRLATAWRDRGEDVTCLGLAGRDGGDDHVEKVLVRAKRTGQRSVIRMWPGILSPVDANVQVKREPTRGWKQTSCARTLRSGVLQAWRLANDARHWAGAARLQSKPAFAPSSCSSAWSCLPDEPAARRSAFAFSHTCGVSFTAIQAPPWRRCAQVRSSAIQLQPDDMLT